METMILYEHVVEMSSEQWSANEQHSIETVTVIWIKDWNSDPLMNNAGRNDDFCMNM